MICPICKDLLILGRKSLPATADDLQTAFNLMDTLLANHDRCVGMAANMIGVSKQIIAVCTDDLQMILLNPRIIRKSGPYETEEGCLSLSGVRKTTRYQQIAVEYQNMQFQKKIQTFTGFAAQVIQHETDHCSGILI